MGGTLVATELSDDDIRKIESLILMVDDLPIVEIDRPGAFGGRRDRRSSDFEFEAMTGVECGPLSGHGHLYRLNLVNGEWTLLPGGSGVS
jgi:hypothetical protein